MSNQNHHQIELNINKDPKEANLKDYEVKDPLLVDEANPKFKSNIEKASYFSRLNFLYTLPLVLKAWRRNKKQELISESDLFTLQYLNRAEVLESKYLEHLQKQKQSDPYKESSTAKAVAMTVKWNFFLTIIIMTYLGFMRIFSAWVMKKLIDAYMEANEDSSEALKWTGVLSVVLIIALFGEHHWISRIFNFGAQIRASIISMLYTKISKLSLHSVIQISSGKLVNIAANDANLFETLAVFLPGFVTGWFFLFAATGLLWTYFGPSCFIGIGFYIVIIPIQMLIMNISSQPLEEINFLTDERVRKISEVIQGIRLLKMYTWEVKFQEIISELRRKDVHLTRKVLYWTNVLSRGLCWGSQGMGSFLMFMLYHLTGGELTVSKAFSAYFVMGFLKIYFVYFVSNGLSFFGEANMFSKRLDLIMNTPEVGQITFDAPLDQQNSVEFDHFTADWVTEQQKEKSEVEKEDKSNKISHDSKATLTDINLNLKKGSFNAIVGSVGAGKTSLLLSFTGEMPKTTGKLRFKGSIAYLEQEPTIFAGTFRESVLFGKSYDEDFYKKVIKACNLENDLKLFPNGDLSEIGEGGNNLSGGQKARLALARAVYANADIYLLDDPLSAVDAKVAKSLYNDTIHGLLKGKTVILVTHRVYFVREAENIIVMDGGRIIGKGNFHQLKEQGVDVKTIFSVEDGEEAGSVEEIEEIKQVSEHAEKDLLIPKNDETSNKLAESLEILERQIQKEAEDGKVDLKTYILLFKEVGWGLMFIILACFILTQFGDIAFGRLLGAWVADEIDSTTALSVLGSIAFSMLLVYILKYFVFTYGFNEASKKYHKKMLSRLIKSPVSFFDANPLGEILNRFSNDIGVLDKYVPLVGLDVIDMIFIVGSNFIIISVINPVLMGPLFGALIVIILLVIFVFPTIKQTKAYHLNTGGPVFSLYSSSISGISIIRIFGQASNLKKKFTQLLHVNNKANINFLLSSSVLGLFIDFAYCFAAIGMIWITTTKITSNGDSSAGSMAAFALALIMSITDVFQWGIRQFCQTNIFMAAASRVQAYSVLPSEAPFKLAQDSEYKKKGWPEKGEVAFTNVYMKYNHQADYVIKDLNLCVSAGEKVGCVGRTGAGKSSTINLLFRLQEIEKRGEKESQSSITISDVNTKNLGLHLLRNNIAIIPQVPFIFTGTVKQNIDPLTQFTDEQIWSALEEVRLKDHVSRLKDKLETKITNASEVFSVGQKQLICLARTLLEPRKILVLDEATANMDTETDNFIQQKIRERFSNSTIFTIAHRLLTIANYDKVLVLDQGKKVEYDSPYKLLVKNIGDKTMTNTSGFFASMVSNTGKKTANQIFNIAKETYFRKQVDFVKNN